MIIQLVDRNQGMCEAWEKEFGSEPNVNIHQGDFFDLPTDCVVSPANSFGFMDGGLDMVISQKLGWGVMTNLQEHIAQHYFGEQLVGQACIVETDNPEIPYVMSAPTMRVPMILKDTVNVYLASKAIFYQLMTNDKGIEKITISGLGTGVGRVPYNVCAKQMKQAYDEMILHKKRFPSSWREAQMRHVLMYSNEDRDLQH